MISKDTINSQFSVIHKYFSNIFAKKYLAGGGEEGEEGGGELTNKENAGILGIFLYEVGGGSLPERLFVTVEIS